MISQSRAAQGQLPDVQGRGAPGPHRNIPQWRSPEQGAARRDVRVAADVAVTSWMGRTPDEFVVIWYEQEQVLGFAGNQRRWAKGEFLVKVGSAAQHGLGGGERGPRAGFATKMAHGHGRDAHKAEEVRHGLGVVEVQHSVDRSAQRHRGRRCQVAAARVHEPDCHAQAARTSARP